MHFIIIIIRLFINFTILFATKRLATGLRLNSPEQ